jgi:hypothetical protein
MIRLPKRINDVLKRKDEFLSKREVMLDKTSMRMQEQLLAKVLSDIIPKLDTKGGKILRTLRNYQLLGQLDKVYKDFDKVQRVAFVKEVGDATKGLALLNKGYFATTLGASLPALFEKIAADAYAIMDMRVGLKGGEIVSGGFLEALITDNSLLTELKNFMAKSVAAQTKTKDFIKGVNDIIVGVEGKPGGIQKQIDRFAHDLFMQYDSAMNNEMAQGLGMNSFLYQAGIIETTRDFCAAMDSKVWTREDAAAWPDWTPSQGDYPVGYVIKQKDPDQIPSYIDYPGYAPLIDRGGFRCRHRIAWIPEELAYVYRAKEKNIEK